MKSLAICVLLMGLAVAVVQSGPTDSDKKPVVNCFKEMGACCSDKTKCSGKECSAKMEGDRTYDDFVKLANDNLIRSWEYLFLSAQFGTHLKQRPGFEKILHGLADEAWNKGFEMIKEGSKRGFEHTFKSVNNESDGLKSQGDTAELPALAKAVDIEKTLLERANRIHLNHQHSSHTETKNYGKYDAALAHYLEEEIIEHKTESIRNLVGHVNDLKKIWSEGSEIYSMSLYLFDQYLAK